MGIAAEMGIMMKKTQRKVTLYDANDARAIPMHSLLGALGVKPDKRGHVKCPFPEHQKHGDAHPSTGSISRRTSCIASCLGNHGPPSTW